MKGLGHDGTEVCFSQFPHSSIFIRWWCRTMLKGTKGVGTVEKERE